MSKALKRTMKEYFRARRLTLLLKLVFAVTETISVVLLKFYDFYKKEREQAMVMFVTRHLLSLLIVLSAVVTFNITEV